MKKIFDKSMDTRINVRLDEKHIKILEKLMQKKGFNSVSEAIRYLIEKSEEK